MKRLSLEEFNQLISETKIKPKLKKEIRFIASTSKMTAEDWSKRELLSVTDRGGNRGVLILAPDEDIYIVPYELSRVATNSKTGRAQPIICDLCRTWQAGSGAGSISFQKDRRSLNSIGFLCCADLSCSDHVRTKTDASRASRAQLREDLDDSQRTERFKARLRKMITDLSLESVPGSKLYSRAPLNNKNNFKK